MAVLGALKKYGARKPDYVTARDNLLISARNFYNGREMIINTFKNKAFSLSTEDSFEDEDEDEDEDKFYTRRE